MSTRVRVLPPVSKRGLLLLSLALGLAHGLIGSWLIALLGDQFFGMTGPVSTFGMIRVALTLAVLFVLPAVPVGMLLARVHPRIGRLLACGALYGAACLPGILAVIVACNPQSLIIVFEPRPQGAIGAVVSVAFFTALGMGVCAAVLTCVFALALAIERFIGKRVIEQTGLICWSCGYNLGSATIPVCPECGEAFDPHARPRAASNRILASLVRLRWGLAALALLVAVGPVVNVLLGHTIPSAQFMLALPAGARLEQAGMMGNYYFRSGASGTSPRTLMPIMYGWWIPDPDSPTTGLAVQYVPQAQGNETSMYITRAFLHDFTVPAGAVIAGPAPKDEMLAPGTARIVARLSRAQAASIIESRSLPPGLAEAIRREAQSQSWAPVDPMVTPAAKQVVVDAAPFFAPDRPHPAAGQAP